MLILQPYGVPQLHLEATQEVDKTIANTEPSPSNCHKSNALIQGQALDLYLERYADAMLRFFITPHNHLLPI